MKLLHRVSAVGMVLLVANAALAAITITNPTTSQTLQPFQEFTISGIGSYPDAAVKVVVIDENGDRTILYSAVVPIVSGQWACTIPGHSSGTYCMVHCIGLNSEGKSSGSGDAIEIDYE